MTMKEKTITLIVRQILAILLLFILQALVTYLLFLQLINSGLFSALFTINILFFLAFYNLEAIREIDFKKFRIMLSQMKDVKTDIYSKSEDMNRIIGKFVKHNISLSIRMGNFGGAFTSEELREKHEEYKDMLNEMDSDATEIAEILIPLKMAIINNFAAKHVFQIIHDTQYSKHEGSPVEWGKFEEELRKCVSEFCKTFEINVISDFIVDHQIEDEALTGELKELEDLIANYG